MKALEDRRAMDWLPHYPYHLAKLVEQRLQSQHGSAPPEAVLVRLFETLYFASLKTEEGKSIVATVNFVESLDDVVSGAGGPSDRWAHIPFPNPLPLDLRTLTKLAKAADPDVSSLTVVADEDGELFVLGMLDQEPRYSESITFEADSGLHRPGLFQATITGAGAVAVYQQSSLIGSLNHQQLVEAYHNVLWFGPIHEMLAGHLRNWLAKHRSQLAASCELTDHKPLEQELLLRWLNSLSRILVNAQHYHHGGGLLITPDLRLDQLHVNYPIIYDRLLPAVVGLVRAHFLRHQAAVVTMQGRVSHPDWNHLRAVHLEVESRKNEVLGCNRFIAALTCVDGVVLLDPCLTVHGFGVELRTEDNLRQVYLASDSLADVRHLREVELGQFGTRHRAMMRYCQQHPGSIGFVVSQDGNIQALARLGERLVLWENIDVQLAFKSDSEDCCEQAPPLLRRLRARSEI